MDNIFIQFYDQAYDMDTPEGCKLRHDAVYIIVEWSWTVRKPSDCLLMNDVLCDTELDRLDAWLIVAALRSTYRYRQFIECWNDKLDEAIVIINRRGLKATHLLRGLKEFPNEQ